MTGEGEPTRETFVSEVSANRHIAMRSARKVHPTQAPPGRAPRFLPHWPTWYNALQMPMITVMPHQCGRLKEIKPWLVFLTRTRT